MYVDFVDKSVSQLDILKFEQSAVKFIPKGSCALAFVKVFCIINKIKTRDKEIPFRVLCNKVSIQRDSIQGR